MVKTTLSGKRTLGLFFSLLGLLSFSVPKARAGQSDQANQPNQADTADQPASNDANDPPSRVARISYIDGSVSLQSGGAGDWAAPRATVP